MTEEARIPTAVEVGLQKIGYLLFSKNEDDRISLSLQTLLHVLGVSKADVAKMTGLTRVRIGQFDGGADIPSARRSQFNKILQDIVGVFEDQLDYVKNDPEAKSNSSLIKEMVPATEAILKICHNTLKAEKKAGISDD